MANEIANNFLYMYLYVALIRSCSDLFVKFNVFVIVSEIAGEII